MKIYILIYDFATPTDQDVSVKPFSKREDAIAELKAKADSLRGEWEKSEISTDEETRFFAHRHGEYSQNHDALWIEEYELNF